MNPSHCLQEGVGENATDTARVFIEETPMLQTAAEAGGTHKLWRRWSKTLETAFVHEGAAQTIEKAGGGGPTQ